MREALGTAGVTPLATNHTMFCLGAFRPVINSIQLLDASKLRTQFSAVIILPGKAILEKSKLQSILPLIGVSTQFKSMCAPYKCVCESASTIRHCTQRQINMFSWDFIFQLAIFFTLTNGLTSSSTMGMPSFSILGNMFNNGHHTLPIVSIARPTPPPAPMVARHRVVVNRPQNEPPSRPARLLTSGTTPASRTVATPPPPYPQQGRLADFPQRQGGVVRRRPVAPYESTRRPNSQQTSASNSRSVTRQPGRTL